MAKSHPAGLFFGQGVGFFFLGSAEEGSLKFNFFLKKKREIPAASNRLLGSGGCCPSRSPNLCGANWGCQAKIMPQNVTEPTHLRCKLIALGRNAFLGNDSSWTRKEILKRLFLC